MMETEGELRENSRLFGKQLRVRKSPVEQSDEVNLKEFGIKLNQERKRVKIDSNQIELSSLREKSNKVRESKLANYPESTKKPTGFEFGDGTILKKFQRILEKSREEKKHGIVKETDLDTFEMVTIESIQRISDSLCVVNVKNAENTRMIWLSCLWNEWINLKIGDLMNLEEIVDICNIKVCRKWKKVLQSSKEREK